MNRYDNDDDRKARRYSEALVNASLAAAEAEQRRGADVRSDWRYRPLAISWTAVAAARQRR